MTTTSSTQVRVRYAETDAMGIVHHAVYPVWMELGRTDLLRKLGQAYTEWEARGVNMAVADLTCRYRAPAKFDDLVEVRTRVALANRRKIAFEYEILRDGVRLVEGGTVHVVTGPDGRARTLPDDLLALVAGAL